MAKKKKIIEEPLEKQLWKSADIGEFGEGEVMNLIHIDTTFLERCIQTLDKAYQLLQQADPESLDYDLYRSATIKEFEIILEQAGKLLKKRLKPYLHSSKAADKLPFKALFRHAGHHDLLNIDEVERWLNYRDNRNSTAHDYGVGLAEKTLPLMPQFILDAQSLLKIINPPENY